MEEYNKIDYQRLKKFIKWFLNLHWEENKYHYYYFECEISEYNAALMDYIGEWDGNAVWNLLSCTYSYYDEKNNKLKVIIIMCTAGTNMINIPKMIIGVYKKMLTWEGRPYKTFINADSKTIEGREAFNKHVDEFLDALDVKNECRHKVYINPMYYVQNRYANEKLETIENLMQEMMENNQWNIIQWASSSFMLNIKMLELRLWPFYHIINTYSKYTIINILWLYCSVAGLYRYENSIYRAVEYYSGRESFSEMYDIAEIDKNSSLAKSRRLVLVYYGPLKVLWKRLYYIIKVFNGFLELYGIIGLHDYPHLIPYMETSYEEVKDNTTIFPRVDVIDMFQIACKDGNYVISESEKESSIVVSKNNIVTSVSYWIWPKSEYSGSDASAPTSLYSLSRYIWERFGYSQHSREFYNLVFFVFVARFNTNIAIPEEVSAKINGKNKAFKEKFYAYLKIILRLIQKMEIRPANSEISNFLLYIKAEQIINEEDFRVLYVIQAKTWWESLIRLMEVLSACVGEAYKSKNKTQIEISEKVYGLIRSVREEK